ncbi:TB2/DP1, HVA22 family-domain-containing protein [Gorgonomyces haynaldii]|nr:TB2/DP1, HVA22 family-domain-containing protein [Gorgonomyces haynaldii]
MLPRRPSREISRKIDMALAQVGTIPAIQHLEFKLGMNTLGVVIVTCFMTLATVLLLLNLGAAFISDIVGFFYPAYQSLRGIDLRQGHKQWVAYWVVFGTLKCMEHFIQAILKVLPIYYVSKSLFIYWLVAPGSQGATKLYDAGLAAGVRFWDSKCKRTTYY